MDLHNLAHPEYSFFKDRLASYSLWPPQLSQSDYSLAHAGLFYSNVSDRVTCFACGIMLWGWKSNDDPWLEHFIHGKNCFYMKMVGGVRLKGLSGTPAMSSKPYDLWECAALQGPWAKNEMKDEPDG